MTRVFLLVLLWQTSAGPQQTAPTRPHVAVETIAARPEDVTTIDGIVKAFYSGSTRSNSPSVQRADGLRMVRDADRWAAGTLANGQPCHRTIGGSPGTKPRV